MAQMLLAARLLGNVAGSHKYSTTGAGRPFQPFLGLAKQRTNTKNLKLRDVDQENGGTNDRWH